MDKSRLFQKKIKRDLTESVNLVIKLLKNSSHLWSKVNSRLENRKSVAITKLFPETLSSLSCMLIL